jgi:DNA-binding MarR family transcriptional regulator
LIHPEEKKGSLFLSHQYDDELQEYFELWQLLSRVRHAIYSARELELREHGITLEQAYMLVRIHDLDNKATQAQLAHFTFRKQNTVSVAVKRMEKQGLLKRVKSKNRKNVATISLTAKGEELYKSTLGRDTINNIMSKISGEQRRQLRSCLGTLFGAAVDELAKSNNKSFLKNIYQL